MESELKRKINEILESSYCPEDYRCAEPDVQPYKSDDRDRFVACLLSDPAACALALPRTGDHECRCVLRAILLEKLH